MSELKLSAVGEWATDIAGMGLTRRVLTGIHPRGFGIIHMSPPVPRRPPYDKINCLVIIFSVVFIPS